MERVPAASRLKRGPMGARVNRIGPGLVERGELGVIVELVEVGCEAKSFVDSPEDFLKARATA
eukprot:scaffold17500_cov126-Isochrysis_galbana.AAC.3